MNFCVNTNTHTQSQSECIKASAREWGEQPLAQLLYSITAPTRAPISSVVCLGGTEKKIDFSSRQLVVVVVRWISARTCADTLLISSASLIDVAQWGQRGMRKSVVSIPQKMRERKVKFNEKCARKF